MDTGFTGHICLAAHLRRRMALRRAGEVEIELADGRRVLQAAFLGEISFDGRQRTVRVEFVRGGTAVVS